MNIYLQFTREDVLAANRHLSLQHDYDPSHRDYSPEKNYKPTDITDIKPMTKKSLSSLEAVPRSGLHSGNSWIQKDDRSSYSPERKPSRRSQIMQQSLGNSSQHWVVEEAERRRLAEKTGRERLQKLQNRQSLGSHRELQMDPGYNSYQASYGNAQRPIGSSDNLYRGPSTASNSDPVYSKERQPVNHQLSKSTSHISGIAAPSEYVSPTASRSNPDLYELAYRSYDKNPGLHATERREYSPRYAQNYEHDTAYNRQVLQRPVSPRSQQQPPSSQSLSFIEPQSHMPQPQQREHKAFQPYDPRYSGGSLEKSPGHVTRRESDTSHSYGGYPNEGYQSRSWYTQDSHHDNPPPVPTKPSMLGYNRESQSNQHAEQVVVSGRQICSHCEQELGKNSIMSPADKKRPKNIL